MQNNSTHSMGDVLKVIVLVIIIGIAGYFIGNNMSSRQQLTDQAARVYNNQAPDTTSTPPSPLQFTSGAWSLATSLPVGVYNHASAKLSNGRIFVAGGMGLGKYPYTEIKKNTQIFNPSTNTWTQGPSLSKGKISMTATLLVDGRVLIAGGSTTNGNNYSPSTTAEIYNPTTNSVTGAGQMPLAQTSQEAVRVNDGRVILIGGYGCGNSAGCTMVQAYDPATNNWSSLASTAYTRNSFSAIYNAQTNKIWVIGGTGICTTNHSIEIYDVATNTWSVGPALKVSRYLGNAVLLPDNRIVIMGGVGCDDKLITSSEVYSPTTNAWSYVGSLPYGMRDFTATLLQNGKVLVVGGGSSAPPSPYGGAGSSQAYLFDSITNTWSAAATTAAIYSFHATEILGNGSVMVMGGTSGSMNAAEVYTP